jgi:large subunit ribosomal protein L25
MIGKQLRAGEIPLAADKMKLLTDPLRVIAHVVTLKKEEEPAPEAAVAAETAAAEPEVIKKGKKEEEGAEGEAPAPKAEKSEKKK